MLLSSLIFFLFILKLGVISTEENEQYFKKYLSGLAVPLSKNPSNKEGCEDEEVKEKCKGKAQKLFII